PGPNSTEMAIHIGYLRAGWPGLITAGACFIAPAACLVLLFAWLYVRYGSTPQAVWLLYGVKPVIIAIIIQALWRLGRTALKGVGGCALAAALMALYLAGLHELLLLFGGAVVYAVGSRWWRGGRSGRAALPVVGLLALGGRQAVAAATAAAGAAVPFSLSALFFNFLKIGAVLYGSGYVLLAFLRNDFVDRLGWLTDRELLDAIAIGQITPGPVFTTATFVGFFTGGWWGAALATLGIFLPAFVFVALIHPLAELLRRSEWTSRLLDGLNVAAVALMAGVSLELGRSALVDPFTWVLAVAAFAVLLRFRLNSSWLIVAGAALGWLAWRLSG
ncbi:MAG TPA: chromate efflux transporter, partial [Limnochordia bacterium]